MISTGFKCPMVRLKVFLTFHHFVSYCFTLEQSECRKFQRDTSRAGRGDPMPFRTAAGKGSREMCAVNV